MQDHLCQVLISCPDSTMPCLHQQADYHRTLLGQVCSMCTYRPVHTHSCMGRGPLPSDFSSPCCMVRLGLTCDKQSERWFFCCCAGLLGPLPLCFGLPDGPAQPSRLSKLPFVAYATFALHSSGWPWHEMSSEVLL